MEITKDIENLLSLEPTLDMAKFEKAASFITQLSGIDASGIAKVCCMNIISGGLVVRYATKSDGVDTMNFLGELYTGLKNQPKDVVPF
jgi:hypothetical protein